MLWKLSHCSPSTPLWMAWQAACQSSSTNGGQHPLSHIRRFDESAQPTFFTFSRRQLFRSFADRCFSKKSYVSDWSSTTGSHTRILAKSPICTESWLSTVMNLRSSSIIFNLLRPWRPSNQHLHKTVTSRLLVRQERQCVHKILAHILQRRVGSKHHRCGPCCPV